MQEAARLPGGPRLFGAPARWELVAGDGDGGARGGAADGGAGEWVVGGPADVPWQEWSYLAYGRPSAARRRLAEDLVGLVAAQRGPRCQVYAFEEHMGVRSPLGFFLLAREGCGEAARWWVAALATAVPGKALPLRIFNELLRASAEAAARPPARRIARGA